MYLNNRLLYLNDTFFIPVSTKCKINNDDTLGQSKNHPKTCEDHYTYLYSVGHCKSEEKAVEIAADVSLNLIVTTLISSSIPTHPSFSTAREGKGIDDLNFVDDDKPFCGTLTIMASPASIHEKKFVPRPVRTVPLGIMIRNNDS